MVAQNGRFQAQTQDRAIINVWWQARTGSDYGVRVSLYVVVRGKHEDLATTAASGQFYSSQSAHYAATVPMCMQVNRGRRGAARLAGEVVHGSRLFCVIDPEDRKRAAEAVDGRLRDTKQQDSAFWGS